MALAQPTSIKQAKPNQQEKTAFVSSFLVTFVIQNNV
jgi:hypothetical protein